MDFVNYFTPTLTIIMILDTLYLYIILFCLLSVSKDKSKGRLGMAKEVLVVQTEKGATYELLE